MKILFLTRYGQLGASSRLRTLQFLPFFGQMGWRCDVQPLFSDQYVQALYAAKGRGRYVPLAYYRRLKALLAARRYDLVWIEKELFPFFPAMAERLLGWVGVPYVVDYDDALFHRYDRHRLPLVRAILGRKIDVVMRHAAFVVTGNRYLAARAEAAGARRVELVPTVIDQDRYKASDRREGPVTIGWIGSPATAHYLDHIAVPLAAVQRRHGVRILFIGSGPIRLRNVQAEIVPWEERFEAELIASIDIGVMPLPDNDWERGKCGYKLIQYMACGRPVVASPVGMNVEIVNSGENGFLAKTATEWENAMGQLVEDADRRQQMGAAGRSRVEQTYSLQVQAPRLAEIFARAVHS